MARIAGVDLPREKRIEVALGYIYGVGRSSSRKILKEMKIDPNVRVKDLKEEDSVRLREKIERDYKVEGDLRKEIAMNVKRLMDIGSFRGFRHRKGLPARGQRTRTNARTRKGPKKAIGVRPKKEQTA